MPAKKEEGKEGATEKEVIIDPAIVSAPPPLPSKHPKDTPVGSSHTPSFSSPIPITSHELSGIPSPPSSTKGDEGTLDEDLETQLDLEVPKRTPLSSSATLPPSPPLSVNGDVQTSTVGEDEDEEVDLIAPGFLPSPVSPTKETEDIDTQPDIPSDLMGMFNNPQNPLASDTEDEEENSNQVTSPVSINLANGEKIKPELSKIYRDKFEDILGSDEVKHKGLNRAVLRKNDEKIEVLEPVPVVFRDLMHSLAERLTEEKKPLKVKISGGTEEQRDQAAMAAMLAGLEFEGHELSSAAKKAVNMTKEKLRNIDPELIDEKAELERIAISGYTDLRTMDSQQNSKLKKLPKFNPSQLPQESSMSEDSISKWRKDIPSGETKILDEDSNKKDFSKNEIEDAIKTTYRHGYGGEIRTSDIKKYSKKLKGKSFETIQDLHSEIKALLIAENPLREWNPEKANERSSKAGSESIIPAKRKATDNESISSRRSSKR